MGGTERCKSPYWPGTLRNFDCPLCAHFFKPTIDRSLPSRCYPDGIKSRFQSLSLSITSFDLGCANRAALQTMDEPFPERPALFFDFVLPSRSKDLFSNVWIADPHLLLLQRLASCRSLTRIIMLPVAIKQSNNTTVTFSSPFFNERNGNITTATGQRRIVLSRMR
jgi:hypothetical protein